MVKLRKPRPVIPEAEYTAASRTLEPAARSCEVCRWPDRCKADRVCWQAEKAAVAADRDRPAQVVWTRELVVEAMRRHTAQVGKPPTADEWACTTPDHPSCTVVRRLFGSWLAGLEAAGYTRSNYGRWARTP